MAWYSTGTIAVTNGSTTVTGTGTDFVGNVLAGQGIILPDGRTYEIAAIVSATQITLGTAYLGSTASGQSYVVQPTRGPDLILVQQVAALISGYGPAFINAGQGKFAAGSATVPSLRNLADENTGINFLGSDQFELVTNGIRRALLSTTAFNLSVPITGTAVTQSATDATAGRLLKVGDFGVGGNATVSGAYAGNVDDLGRSGIYTLTNGASSSSSGSILAIGDILQHLDWNDGSKFQMLFRRNVSGNPRIYYRALPIAGGPWSAWFQVMHQGSILGAVSQSLGVPTGALIERGSNANGSYARYADGTQICWVTLAASAAGAATWTFPAVFSAAPAVNGTAIATVLSGVMLDAAPSTTAATFSARDKADARRADTCHLTATGRWF